MVLLMFLGVVQEVIGFCYLLEIFDGVKVLFECGMCQGCCEVDNGNCVFFFFDFVSIDVVVIFYVYLDYSGLLLCLVVEGFKGLIFVIEVICELLEFMLLDFVYIQEKDVEWENCWCNWIGKLSIKLLYIQVDIECVFKLCWLISFGSIVVVVCGVWVIFYNVGYIFGLLIVEV